MATLAVGMDKKLFMKKETTFDTLVAQTATDAVSGPGGFKLTPDVTDAQRKEALGSGSVQGFTRGLEKGKWSHSTYVKPASAGTAPDIGPGLEAAFGTETVNGGTSVVYTCNDSAKSSLTLMEHAGSEQQTAHGCWVEQLDIEVKENDFALFNFSGGYARSGYARNNVVTTGNSSGQSTVTLAAGTIANFRAGSMVQFSGHATGYLISSINYSTFVITLASALGSTVANGETISPYSPTLTTAGLCLFGIDNNVIIDSVDYAFKNAKISIKTGTHGKDKEASATRPTGSIKGPRLVELEIQAYMVDTTVGPIVGKGWREASSAVTLRIGSNTAAQRCKIAMPNVRWMVVQPDIPDAEEVTVTLKGTACQSAAAGDEVAMTFD